MNTRGLLAALSLGGAIIGTRVLAGPAVDQRQLATFPGTSIDRTICTAGNGTELRQRRQNRAAAGLQAESASAPAEPCPR